MPQKIRENYQIKANIKSRGFNGSVNISENCDFRSQYDPLLHNFIAFYLKYSFVFIYISNEKV